MTLLWAEDNHGYVRQLSNATERMRSGGSGIYYHVSYWGSPTSYLWLASTPLTTIYEEMSKAYAYNAKRVWIVNVTGLKAHEISMEFFLSLGWNVNAWNPGNIASFVTAEAARDFGPANAADIADIVMRTYQLNIARRPEFMGKTVFNLVNYGDEAQQRLDAFSALLTRATSIYNALPPAKQDGFFEMVLYPLRASYYQNQKYIAAAKADLYAQQGRTASVTTYRNLSTTAFSTIATDLSKYTTGIQSGKWQSVLNPYSTTGGRPAIEGQPSMASAPAASAAPLGVVWEGQTTGSESLPLAFSSYTQDKRFIDIFTKGSAGFSWTATPSAPWIKLSASSGTITDEARVWVSIDWASVPSGSSMGTVTVSAGGASKTVNVSVSNPATPSRSGVTGYVEANGYVAIEAEHFTAKVDRGGATWQVFTQLGRGAGDAVKAMPDLSPSVTTNLASASPELDYNVYFFTTGSFPVTVYRMPTLNTTGACRLAIGVGRRHAADPVRRQLGRQLGVVGQRDRPGREIDGHHSGHQRRDAHVEAVRGRPVGRRRPHRGRHRGPAAVLPGSPGELLALASGDEPRGAARRQRHCAFQANWYVPEPTVNTTNACGLVPSTRSNVTPGTRARGGAVLEDRRTALGDGHRRGGRCERRQVHLGRRVDGDAHLPLNHTRRAVPGGA